MKKYLLLLLLLGNMYDSWSLGISGNMSEKQQVNMIDNGKALVNPDMGWTMHFYSNVLANYGSKLEPSDVIEYFPGVSTVYLRIPWSFVEPEEGKFNWVFTTDYYSIFYR